jgi:hypothetical protein
MVRRSRASRASSLRGADPVATDVVAAVAVVALGAIAAANDAADDDAALGDIAVDGAAAVVVAAPANTSKATTRGGSPACSAFTPSSARSSETSAADFTDSTAAELMIESLGRLLKRHLVLFVVLRDEELEGLAAAAPEMAEDVSRAVVAASLLRERETVIGRLRRMGAHIVDAPADQVGPEAVNAYLDLKRRDLL